jgi:hypothetical protein
MFAAVPRQPVRATTTREGADVPQKREPLVMTRCSCQLWEGVSCALPAGHHGSHFRPATADGCELRWRSVR